MQVTHTDKTDIPAELRHVAFQSGTILVKYTLSWSVLYILKFKCGISCKTIKNG